MKSPLVDQRGNIMRDLGWSLGKLDACKYGHWLSNIRTLGGNFRFALTTKKRGGIFIFRRKENKMQNTPEAMICCTKYL